MISISNFSASSLYRFLIVTSVTPATSATSRWVLRSPPRIEEMYIAAAAAGRSSPNGHELLAAGCYLFCASALALVVGGADISGRMNLAAPFIAFATSLLGGCFADTAARGGLFAKLALLTPQGLCIAGADGSVACLAVLAGAGVVLLALKRAALRVKFAERR